MFNEISLEAPRNDATDTRRARPLGKYYEITSIIPYGESSSVDTSHFARARARDIFPRADNTERGGEVPSSVARARSKSEIPRDIYSAVDLEHFPPSLESRLATACSPNFTARQRRLGEKARTRGDDGGRRWWRCDVWCAAMRSFSRLTFRARPPRYLSPPSQCNIAIFARDRPRANNRRMDHPRRVNDNTDTLLSNCSGNFRGNSSSRARSRHRTVTRVFPSRDRTRVYFKTTDLRRTQTSAALRC